MSTKPVATGGFPALITGASSILARYLRYNTQALRTLVLAERIDEAAAAL
jgi:hypothetical protein